MLIIIISIVHIHVMRFQPLLVKRGTLARDRLHQSPKDFGGIDEEGKEVIREIESTDVEEYADDSDERARDGEEELDKGLKGKKKKK